MSPGVSLAAWPFENELTLLSQALFVELEAGHDGGDTFCPLYVSWVDLLIFTQMSGSLHM